MVKRLLDIFGALGYDAYVAKAPRSLFEKDSLSLMALDERDLTVRARHRDRKTGETCPGSQIRDPKRPAWEMAGEEERLPVVPLDGLRERVNPREVQPPIPKTQELPVGFELAQLFVREGNEG